MTSLHFNLTDAKGTGLTGMVSLVLTKRVTVRDAIRLPVAQIVHLSDGEATVDILPSTTQWVWRVSEMVSSGITRYVEVPASETTLEYSGLTDIDPHTLDPSSSSAAAWEMATRSAQSVLDQIDAVDDRVGRAETAAQAAKASEGVAQQEADKAGKASDTASAMAATATSQAEAASASAANAKTLETKAQASADSAAASAVSIPKWVQASDEADATSKSTADPTSFYWWSA